jgi:hypothetical protein
MIYNVAFSGRETLLTKPVKETVSKVHEYMPEGIIVGNGITEKTTKAAKDIIEKDLSKIYKKAHAPIEETAEKTTNLSEAYRAAHAPYTVTKPETEGEIFAEAYQAAHGGNV